MNRRQLVWIVILILGAAFVGVLVLRNRQAPRLPVDIDHAAFRGADACLECHGPDGGAPQSRNHPVGRDCLNCHGVRR